MKKVWIFFSVFLFALPSLPAQTTVSISTTVKQSGLPRFGVNMGDDANYGQGQLLKDLNFANNSYMASFYWQASFPCNAGGTNSTTQWYNNSSGGNYPANFWVGASYIAVNAATGTAYGTGTITASSANSSTGMQFTLSNALSSACSTSAQDMLIVKLANASPTLTTPQQSQSFCTGATWNTSDTDPASTNTVQSLKMPNGCTISYGIDPGLPNATNTNPTLAAQAPSWINLNGSYSAVFMAKCPSSSGTSTLTVSASRLNGTVYIPSTNETLTCNSNPGVGWQTFTINFTASETGAQGQNLQYIFTCTGTCLLQEAHLYEGSTLAGNTTPFRDSVVRKLQAINPGSLRFMGGADWCSDVADMIAGQGNNRGCTSNSYVAFSGNPYPMNYDTRLQLCAFLGADCWITVGNLTVASDWTALINWLSTDASYIALKNAGHKVYLEDGNETWNFGVQGGLWAGGGATYGYFLGPNMVAAKAAGGYDSAHMKLVSDNQDGGYGTYSWLATSLNTAGCSTSTPAHCPDFQDSASYTLSYLGSFTASGSNVSTTGAPFLDEWAEITNLTQATPPVSTPATSSFSGATAYGKTNYGVNMALYEANISPTGGNVSPTQLQLNQIGAGVGAGLITIENFLLMQRDAGAIGPINLFTLPQNNYSYNNSSPVAPQWGIERYMACGPAQLSTCADVDRPQSIALQIVNNAIGSKNNLMSTTQSGTPTFGYAGGQLYPGWGNSIAPNTSVPYVNCFSYSNSANTNWATICFNNNLSSSETVTLSGAGAPNGSVTQTTFPGSSNLITDNNENTFTGSGSIAPVVTTPTPISTSGTTYTIPPASFIALTYSTSSASQPSPPTGLTGTATPQGSM